MSCKYKTERERDKKEIKKKKNYLSGYQNYEKNNNIYYVFEKNVKKKTLKKWANKAKTKKR